MATSKSGATKKSTAKKASTRTAAKKTTTKATTITTVKTAAMAKKPSVFKKADGEPNYPAIIIAEVIGTFVLTLVALLTLQQVGALYVGLTLTALVLAIGAVSGAHVNPAVTFGLWAARRIKAIAVPIYWTAQFVGAILAVLILGLFTGKGYSLDFGHFATLDWHIMGVELVATAVFLFGLMAAISNDKLSNIGKSLGVGLSLFVGILVSGSLLTAIQGSVDTTSADVSKPETIPRSYVVKGATLNPAVALAATENTSSQLSGYNATEKETKYSRLGAEVIFGTLIGAALGTNLYLLLAYVNRQEA